MRTHNMLSEMQVTLAEVATNVENNTRILNRMDQVINGNGRSGLVVKVARHGQFIRIVTWAIGILLAASAGALCL